MDALPPVSRAWVHRVLSIAYRPDEPICDSRCADPTECLSKALLITRHMTEHAVISAHVRSWLQERGL